MILNDLCAYYDRKPKADVLLRESDIDEVCPLHWTVKSVSWEIAFTTEGRVASCIPLVVPGTKSSPMPKLLPDIARSSGIRAYVFADNSMYVLGDDEKRGVEAREDFVRRQHEVLDGVDDEAVRGFLALLERDPATLELTDGQRASLKEGKGLIAFRLDTDPFWMELQNRPACKEAWERYAACEFEDDGEEGMCLVTGDWAPLARLFPQVTGVPNANSSGASLVSFNQPAFLSYGQQSASISRDAAFRCGEALRYLLKSPAHRVLMGNDSVIFWTDSDARLSLNFLSMGLGADGFVVPTRKGGPEDTETLAEVQNNLLLIRRGLPLPGVDENDHYYVLGIAPYQARLAVRFYERGTLGTLRRNLETFLRDTDMVGVEPRSLRAYLEQLTPPGNRKEGKDKAIPSPLITSCMRALLRGTPFPDALYEQLLARMRADRATRNHWDMGVRAAMMRAYLIRRERMAGGSADEDYERSLTVALNEENRHVGYLLGRLFAVLEKAQIDAVGGGRASNVNATIRDRFMGAASTTPARVYPQLLNLSRHYIKKSDYGVGIDRRIQSIMGVMSDAPFPATLDYEEQGLFYVGYYQQKEDLYARKSAQVGTGDAGDDESFIEGEE